MKSSLLIISLVFLGACQTYSIADRVKLVSFSDDFAEGKSIGLIRGEDCQKVAKGVAMGGNPPVATAMENAQTRSSNSVGAIVGTIVGSMVNGRDKKGEGSDFSVRYMNDVSTGYEVTNFIVMQQTCLIVKERGFK